MPARIKWLVRLASVTCISSAALLVNCGSFDRNNPVDPGGAAAQAQAELVVPEPGLRLTVSLPKALVSVVDSVVAHLTGPNIVPVVKQLQHSPLGPATVTLGALSPGLDRVLIIEGYNHEGNLVMRAEKRNINITVGDTTRITMNMELMDLPENDNSEDNSVDGSTDDAGNTPGKTTKTDAPATSEDNSGDVTTE